MCYTLYKDLEKEDAMLALNGYIDGNTLIATDDSLKNFHGDEILIRIVKKNARHENIGEIEKAEKLSALKAIGGVLNQNKAMTIADIRAERLGL
ncbi:MAG: hypothetical protein ILP07_12675 [Treponema sp.]|jgi:hypothetical protein|nr:hypothetical protein [Treponema sp.]